jgi:tetratricopeptide (TPR) repeat protein
VGRLLAEQGRLTEALDYHQQERTVCSQLGQFPSHGPSSLHPASGDAKAEALAHRSLGKVLLLLSRFEESIEHKERYLLMAKELRDAAEEQRALYGLGQAKLPMAEEQPALEYFRKSLNSVREIPACQLGKGEREIMKARCLRSLAGIRWARTERAGFQQLLGQAREALGSADAKKHFMEDIHGLYDEAANLLMAGDGLEDLKKADEYSNLSVLNAQKVHGKREKVCYCNALVTRSKVLILQEKFEKSYRLLLTAYKLQVSSDAALDNNLKLVVTVVRAQESLHAAKEAAHLHLEEIADALCKYIGGREKKQVLGLALKYYRKATKKAAEEGATDSLPALNSSIAVTYMDMGDIPNAETYFLKQLEYETSLPESACQTNSNIASVQESQGRGLPVVLATMRRWLELAERHQLRAQERVALAELVALHHRLEGGQGGGTHYQERLALLGTDSEPLTSSQGSRQEDRTDNFPDIDITTAGRTVYPPLALDDRPAPGHDGADGGDGPEI